MHKLLTIAVIAAGAAFGAPAMASESLPQPLAQRLDGVSAGYTMTDAKRRRLMIIENTQRQQQHGRPGYGPRPGYGSHPDYGPRPGYGYGPRPGWHRPPPRW